MSDVAPHGGLKRVMRVRDGLAVTVGIVIGAGIQYGCTLISAPCPTITRSSPVGRMKHWTYGTVTTERVRACEPASVWTSGMTSFQFASKGRPATGIVDRPPR